MLYSSVLDTVGNTPIVELSKLAPPGVRLFGKLESFNPMGSVKDRMALAAIDRAERDGTLKPGQTVVEASSGNTGIGLAMVCAAKGYPLVVVMAESFSVERRRLMRFLGAKVVLTPAYLKGSGMYLKAAELAQKHGWFLVRQFENEANADAHTETTAQEILRDFEGLRLDYFVTVFGTGGTLKGVGRGLRAGSPHTRIIAAEPDNAQILGSGVPQPISTGLAPASHPKFQPHPIQGVAPDFISELTRDAVAAGFIDELVPVNGADALRLSRELAVREGVFSGISSGATLAAAMKVAQTAQAGSTILCMLPDTGERYLSTPLFEQVAVDMTEEEQEISRSTDSARFGAAASPPPAAAPATDREAVELLDGVIEDQPVTLFALEWCEFCWSLRKLLDGLGVAYRDVALDAVALQKDELGARLRRALTARTGIGTIPQLFIGGEFVGGCMDAFDGYVSGQLQARLQRAGLRPRTDLTLEPTDLLPKWLLVKPKLAAA